MKRFSLLVVAALLPAVIAAAEPPTPTRPAATPGPQSPGPKPKSGWKWEFNLLPKSMQRNPKLLMTVHTELTAAGKARPEVSPASPAFFEPYAAGYKQLGGAIAGEHPPPDGRIEEVLRHALAANGYFEAKRPAHPPTHLIIYHWGSHNALDPLLASMDPLAARKNLYDRAVLVAGEEFAGTLMENLSRDELIAQAYSNLNPVATEGQMQLPSFFPTGNLGISSDVNVMADFEENMKALIEQIYDDVYFVIASAFDYQEVARGRYLLLWRTRMTVNTIGVSMSESLPRVIAAGAPYLGREMTVAVPLQARVDRMGKVELGELEVIGIESIPTERTETPAEPTPAATADDPAGPPATAPVDDPARPPEQDPPAALPPAAPVEPRPADAPEPAHPG